MSIVACQRCESCGYITGFPHAGWETPWSQWAAQETAGPRAETSPRMLKPRPCPDCGGTGAFITGLRKKKASVAAHRLWAGESGRGERYPARTETLVDLHRLRSA